MDENPSLSMLMKARAVRSGACLGIVLMALLADPASATSEDKRSRDVFTAWLVVPMDPPSGIADVRSGSIVFRQRVVPAGYAMLDSDAIDDTSGSTIVPHGTG
ncbi:MAG: hypothetical protein LC656_02790, partial [Sphingomonadales bacterium]|nr:hypothetical protein [Sphingomonadales bacterium]